jgi:hypothetical protein
VTLGEEVGPKPMIVSCINLRAVGAARVPHPFRFLERVRVLAKTRPQARVGRAARGFSLVRKLNR